MTELQRKVEIHRGLKGVYFDRSRVCFIDGRAGELRYRGYSIHDLAATPPSRRPATCCSRANCPRARSSTRSPPSSRPRARCRRRSTTSSARSETRTRWTCCAPRSRRSPAFDPEAADNSPRGDAAQGRPAHRRRCR